MADLRTEKITLPVGDGTRMDAHVARPSGKAQRGLMVFQEAFGVNDHIRDVARRFAEQGYLAIAPELFHRTAPGFEGKYTDFQAVTPHLHALTENGMEADVRATYEWLHGEVGDHIACTGYCMGGRVSYLANTTVRLKAAVSYYGGGIPSLLHRQAQSEAPILFFWGDNDTHISHEQRRLVLDGLRNAQKHYVSVDISDADHGFFCDQRASYNPHAAKLTWRWTLDFLEQQFTRETHAQKEQ
jgi:carboxymethylenebutenolidase